MAEEYELYLAQRLLEDITFEEGALYAGRNALIYNSVQEEGNIYTVLKNSSKKYVDNFEVIKLLIRPVIRIVQTFQMD